MKKACFECGEPATENHHVVPRSKGGGKTIPLCLDCHNKIHGVKRLNTSYLSILGLARNHFYSYYAFIFWNMVIEEKSLEEIFTLCKTKSNRFNNLLKHIYMFHWEDLYELINKIIQTEKNNHIVYTKDYLEERWQEFKLEFPTPQSIRDFYNLTLDMKLKKIK